MARASVPTLPAPSGNVNSPSPRSPAFAKRRRLFLLVCVAILAVAAALANYGPIQAYRDARARLEKTSAQVEALEAQRIELQSQLGKLSETGYLENLAREELTYSRPGEYVYIVSGLEEGGVQTAGTDGAAGTAGAAETEGQNVAAGPESGTAGAESDPAGIPEEPGFLERLVSGFLGLF